MINGKGVALFSGGMDSTVLLAHMMSAGITPLALTIDYGQRHAREIKTAGEIAAFYDVQHKIACLPRLRELLGGSALTSDIVVPTGPYTEEALKVTVVPNRNMILLAIAAGWAISEGADSVWGAMHAGDHAIYPDCRPEFLTAMKIVLRLSHFTELTLGVPFQNMSKAEICVMGRGLGAPMGMSWSCYKGGEKHCGICSTCTERKAAFVKAGVGDITLYEE